MGAEMVKGVADIEREILALGGEYHVDGNEVLLMDGSKQKNVRSFNIYVGRSPDARIEYHSMINHSHQSLFHQKIWLS